jgi:hypothetical protein
MRTAQKCMWLMALIALVAACQSPNQVLSKSESRMEIMNTIASDHEMSDEMMDAIMRGEHGKMLIHERMKTMMKDKNGIAQMMKDDPEMKKRMMSGMMETVKADTAMMAQMCTTMMKNPEMMDMMKKMKEKDTSKLDQ